MAYPTLEQYNLAFQHHSKLLVDPELASGALSTTGLGLPLAISGGFALTYTVKTGSKKFAVRCFHRESKALERRYAAIAARLGALHSPYFLDFEFQPKGIKVDGLAYPIVKMAWAQGQTLGEFLEANHSRAAAIGSLSDALAPMATYLERQRIAHGDLQPGNMMVSAGGARAQLIDYDGMYVDEIKGVGSAELGHVNFQHPERAQAQPFDPTLDRFSFISLFVALDALRADPSIWRKTNSEADAIVFRANDFADPDSSAAFALLGANPKLAQSAKNFAAICKSPMASAPSLEDFIAGMNIPAVKVALGGAPKAGTAALGYLGAYDVLPALDYDACLRRVGDKVEVVGQVVEVKEDRGRGGKPYLFINFGPWRGRIFKISIWSDGLAAIKAKPDKSWVGKWVSVVGLMEPPYVSARYKYSHLSIAVSAPNQAVLISEAEARRRLAGGGKRAAWKPTTNQEALEAIKGRTPAAPGPTAAAPAATTNAGQVGSMGLPASTPRSANQTVLAAILAEQPAAAVTLAPSAPSRATSAPTRRPTHPSTPPAAAPSVHQPKSSLLWLLTAFGAFGAFAIFNTKPTPTMPSSVSPTVGGPSAATVAPTPRPAFASVATGDRAPGATDELAPPLTRHGRLTMPQMRYCVATSMRIDAWRAEARPMATQEAARLRSGLMDFNARCFGYETMGEDYRIASEQIAPRRSEIERDARIAWFSSLYTAPLPIASASAPRTSLPAATLASGSEAPRSVVPVPQPAQPNSTAAGRPVAPAHARLDYFGRAWVCERGYVQSGDQCSEVVVPANAQIDYTGHGWACKRGYVEAKGTCAEVQMPANAQLDYTGHNWACKRGFAVANGACLEVLVPANARLDFTGHAWTCVRGYVPANGECRPLPSSLNSPALLR